MVSQKLFPAMLSNSKSPNTIAKENGWIQEDDIDIIEDIVVRIIKKYPDKVMEYQNGKKNLIGLFMGEIMRESKGKFNPKKINEILKIKLEK